MAVTQFNKLPQFLQPLSEGSVTSKDWYFFWAGLFKRLPPANESPIVVGASPFTYVAPAGGAVIVRGGTVTAIQFSRNGTDFYNIGATNGMFPIGSADRFVITHAGAPTMTFVPL